MAASLPSPAWMEPDCKPPGPASGAFFCRAERCEGPLGKLLKMLRGNPSRRNQLLLLSRCIRTERDGLWWSIATIVDNSGRISSHHLPRA
jgi:hypothetical protein